MHGGGDSFVEPLTIRSVNGVLDVTLVIAYLTTVLDGATVTLRNFHGTIPAPTLRVSLGDTLRIKVVNNLPPNPPRTEPMWSLHYPNSTNLHTRTARTCIRASSCRRPATIPASTATTSSTIWRRASSPAKRASTSTGSARIILPAPTGINRTCTDRAPCRSAAAWPAR